MIKDKKQRQELIARYLEADTTVQEEIMLAEYFRTHRADDDESDIARVILMDYPKADMLSDPDRKGKVRSISLIITAAAACIALLVLWSRPFLVREFTVSEIADNMNILMQLNNQDVESIVAEPKGTRVILTTRMKDGSSSTFIMVRNWKDGSTRILAEND